MKLTMLGSGNALAIDCYNTCFLLEDKGQTFLADGGGGNTIKNRKMLYKEQGSKYYRSNLYIPYDLETIEL